MAAEFKEKEGTIASVLKMKHVVFDEITFKRRGFKTKGDTQLGIGKHVERTGEGQYQVTLSVQVEKKQEYDAVVTVTAYCENSENTPDKDRILNENAIAILFPYVRAQLTLITAQPETDALVLPAVNINAMIKEAKELER